MIFEILDYFGTGAHDIRWMSALRGPKRSGDRGSFYIANILQSLQESIGYPSIDSLKAISRYFSVTIDELICSEEIMNAAKEKKRYW